MTLKKLLSPLSLAVPLALALTAATPAFAGTISFGSYAGSQPGGFANGAISYDNTGAGAPFTNLKTGTVSAYDPGYSNTIAGTTWVSYDPATKSVGDNGGLTVYSTSYTGNLAGYAGNIMVLADDRVDVYLNSVFLGTTAPSAYDTLKSFGIGAGVFKDGLNTFTFNVSNNNGTTTNGGPTGLDFKAVAATPEPSSVILLGTGALSLAGAVRRRLLA